jgi:hypothetical protein
MQSASPTHHSPPNLTHATFPKPSMTSPTKHLFPLKPTSTHVKAYYTALALFHEHRHKTEGNTRSAFADLLKRCASPYDWHLVEEYYSKPSTRITPTSAKSSWPLRVPLPSSTPLRVTLNPR